MKYRSEVDGLRAVAVLPVVLFHGGFELFGGGYLGVDVFFVISGYLITSIIWQDLERGRFSIRQFYERRARRILPALFAIMIACVPMAWWLLAPNDMTDFSESILAVLAFSSNVLFWSETSYFDTAGELKPLLHTWSLAVEEQYYIAFPLFLLLLRKAGRAKAIAAMITIAVFSFALSEWAVHAQPSAAFFLLPTRVWELMLGGVIALGVSAQKPVGAGPAQAAGVVGLGMIIYSIFAFDAYTPTPSLYTAIPVAGTALVLAYATTGTFAAALLSLRPLVGLGLISYSVYLWHQPLFAFARHASVEEPEAWVRASIAAIAVLCGALSWRFIERPFRTNTSGSGRKHLALAAAVALGLVSFSVAGIASAGFARRTIFAVPAIPGYSFDNKALTESARNPLRSASGDRNYAVFRNAADQTLWFTGNPAIWKVLIVGNSHSIDLYNVLALNRELFPEFQFARYGVQISSFGHPDGDLMFTAPNYLAADVIMVSTRWSSFRFESESRGRSDFKGLEKLLERTRSDKKLLVLTSETLQFPQFGNLTLADHLVLKLAGGRRGSFTPQDVAMIVNRRYFESATADIRTRRTNDTLAAFAAKHGLLYLDKGDFICDRPACECLAIVRGANKTYRDSGHFTVEGAQAFGERAAEIGWLQPIARALDAK
jgi:peptidoglycan/LPS O-acetylase OafA/YrhL